MNSGLTVGSILELNILTNNKLELLKFVYDKKLINIHYTNAMDNASKYGYIDIVKYFHEIGKDCTEWAMDYASSSGHIEVVKYLHEIGKDCSKWAMDWASRGWSS